MGTRKRISEIAVKDVDLFPELSWLDKKISIVKVKIVLLTYKIKKIFVRK